MQLNSNLITAVEFASLRDISKKIDTDKVNEAISLAQKSDLYEALNGFYFDLIKEPNAEKYSDLMNGSEFEYCGENYIHEGLKAFLADLVYARFIYMINVNLTPFGAQQKFTQDSSGVDRNVIKDLVKQAQIDGNAKFKVIKKYLLSNPNGIFDRYCKGEQTGTGSFGLRISKL